MALLYVFLFFIGGIFVLGGVLAFLPSATLGKIEKKFFRQPTKDGK
jgi:hypothetical protein